MGGPCEGCEAIFEYGDQDLNETDTLPEFGSGKVDILIKGIVFENDEITPAAGVVLYVYHTNDEGIYPVSRNESNWSGRHGYLRGWIKTNKEGEFRIYTTQPGSYPGRTVPAHIHITILEPDGKYYYIQNFHFKGDPFLSESEINPNDPRGGGPGLIEFKYSGGIRVGEKNIVLGKNIPGYSE